MTWAPESEPKISSEISRNHLVENHDFSLQPVFSLQNGYANAFCSDPQLAFDPPSKPPKHFVGRGGGSDSRQHFVV